MDRRVEPFELAVSDEVLQDLHQRLERVRWPDPEPVMDWSQGVPLARIQQLVAYWRQDYDWRRCEAKLNGLGQFRSTIEGLGIHFLHIRSPHPGALPLLLTHGWPGSVIEFLKVIAPLTEPCAHGGLASDAFDLVIPSLPGFGFSDKPGTTGWGVGRTARVWDQLMQRLGYGHYVAQGGDWGAAVTTALGIARPPGLMAIHLNMPLVLPKSPYDNVSEQEARMLEALADYREGRSGYSSQQMTRPQTLGYSLADSPVGQAAWIYEKYAAWSDCSGDPLQVFSADEMLDNIMMYWLSNSATSSARLYWESFAAGFAARTLDIPTGCSIFPKDIYVAPRSWAQRCMKQLIYWNEVECGGHFAAFEQPQLFVEELRACFRLIR